LNKALSAMQSEKQKNQTETEKNHLLKQISFIKEIDQLKYIQRKTRLFNSNRQENDAEHSWHLAMMALILAEHSDKPVDML
jgi:putative hydrolase of HD superfamily